MEIPPVVRFVTGYQTGAKSVNPNVKTLNQYIPSFTDPAKGKEVGLAMMAQKADVIFGVGGNTGNGGLTAAKEKGAMGIGVDVDQYLTFPDVKDILITSAAKNVDVAVFNALKDLAGGSLAGWHADGQHQERRRRPGPVPRLGQQDLAGVQGQGRRGVRGPQGRHPQDRLSAVADRTGFVGNS